MIIFEKHKHSLQYITCKNDKRKVQVIHWKLKQFHLLD